MRVVLCALCALFLGGAVYAASPAPLSVSLPDTGTYSVWVQAKTGTVSVLPLTVTHKKTLALPGAHAGDTLFVLDAHTGQIAARPLAAGTGVTLAVSDFRPVSAPTSSPVAAPSAVPPPAPAQPKGRSGGFGQFVSWLLGLALAAGVVWFLIRLVQTRGEPLIVLARKVGIDVPDPKALDPDAGVMPVYQPPKPRAVETIPDDAGLPPQAAPRVPPTEGVRPLLPQLVGTEGLAAGSTFALTSDETTVGRDGGSDIVLAETSVSRRHALFTREGSGSVIRLADTGSANGVFVNGRRVQDVVLVHGDEIRIGDNAFRFEAPAA